jgi:hypothetical protein
MEQEFFRFKGKNVDVKPLTCPNVIAYRREDKKVRYFQLKCRDYSNVKREIGL